MEGVEGLKGLEGKGRRGVGGEEGEGMKDNRGEGLGGSMVGELYMMQRAVGPNPHPGAKELVQHLWGGKCAGVEGVEG